jgi:hypothetical protein
MATCLTVSVSVFVCLSFFLSICFWLSVFLHTCQINCQCVSLSVFLPVSFSVYPHACLPDCQCICLCLSLSICLFVCLPPFLQPSCMLASVPHCLPASPNSLLLCMPASPPAQTAFLSACQPANVSQTKERVSEASRPSFKRGVRFSTLMHLPFRERTSPPACFSRMNSFPFVIVKQGPPCNEGPEGIILFTLVKHLRRNKQVSPTA